MVRRRCPYRFLCDGSVTIKDLYQTRQQTRNLEIGLFWQRSNYFLVLSSGLALGFFNLWSHRAFAVTFAAIGVIVSGLWIDVCLGGKYWQTRWEQRLQDFEIEQVPNIEFFGASREKTDADVRKGLGESRANSIQDFIYQKMVLGKPSVSYSMIRLAIVFAVGWIFALGYAAIGAGTKTP